MCQSLLKKREYRYEDIAVIVILNTGGVTKSGRKISITHSVIVDEKRVRMNYQSIVLLKHGAELPDINELRRTESLTLQEKYKDHYLGAALYDPELLQILVDKNPDVLIYSKDALLRRRSNTKNA